MNRVKHKTITIILAVTFLLMMMPTNVQASDPTATFVVSVDDYTELTEITRIINTEFELGLRFLNFELDNYQVFELRIAHIDTPDTKTLLMNQQYIKLSESLHCISIKCNIPEIDTFILTGKILGLAIDGIPSSLPVIETTLLLHIVEEITTTTDTSITIPEPIITIPNQIWQPGIIEYVLIFTIVAGIIIAVIIIKKFPVTTKEVK